jgi:hypothetical protein
VIFSLAALTGVPTARAPAAMLANAGVLLAGAALVFLGFAAITARLWDEAGRGAATLAILPAMDPRRGRAAITGGGHRTAAGRP